MTSESKGVTRAISVFTGMMWSNRLGLWNWKRAEDISPYTVWAGFASAVMACVVDIIRGLLPDGYAGLFNILITLHSGWMLCRLAKEEKEREKQIEEQDEKDRRKRNETAEARTEATAKATGTTEAADDGIEAMTEGIID